MFWKKNNVSEKPKYQPPLLDNEEIDIFCSRVGINDAAGTNFAGMLISAGKGEYPLVAVYIAMCTELNRLDSIATKPPKAASKRTWPTEKSYIPVPRSPTPPPPPSDDA